MDDDDDDDDEVCSVLFQTLRHFNQTQQTNF